MKTVVLLVLVLGMWSCGCPCEDSNVVGGSVPDVGNVDSLSKVMDARIECILDDREYNKELDSFVREMFLSKQPLQVYGMYGEIFKSYYYKIRYEECEFLIIHKIGVPYEQDDEWQYICTGRDGKGINIWSIFNDPDEMCSEETYKLIRDYCSCIK